jgi:hypothetical protein
MATIHPIHHPIQMITVLADSHFNSLAAERVAEALRADGASDVHLDEGFANPMHIRIQCSGKWLVHIRGRDTVAVRNRYEGTVTSSMDLSKFLNNWRDYIDE